MASFEAASSGLVERPQLRMIFLANFVSCSPRVARLSVSSPEAVISILGTNAQEMASIQCAELARRGSRSSSALSLPEDARCLVDTITISQK